MPTPNQNQTKAQDGNPPAESRQVEARFYRSHVDEAPSWVIIEGSIYGIEHDQEGLQLQLRYQDVKAQLLAVIGAEPARLLMQLEGVLEQLSDHALDDREQRLVQMLPRHELIIRHVFCPAQYPVSDKEQEGHLHCSILGEGSPAR